MKHANTHSASRQRGNRFKHGHFQDDKCVDLHANRTWVGFILHYIWGGQVGHQGFVFSLQVAAPPQDCSGCENCWLHLNCSVNVWMSQNFVRSHKLRSFTASSQILKSRRTREPSSRWGASPDWLEEEEQEEVRAKLIGRLVHCCYFSRLNTLDLAPTEYSRWKKNIKDFHLTFLWSFNVAKHGQHHTVMPDLLYCCLSCLMLYLERRTRETTAAFAVMN